MDLYGDGSIGESATAAGLVARARHGDEIAFAALLQDWTPALLRAATLVTGEPARGHGALQRAWLRMVRDPEPPGPHRAWIWMCRLLLEETLGADPRQLASTPCAPAVDPGRFHPLEHRFPGDWTAPPVSWPSADLGAGWGLDTAIRTALGRLPTDHRVVLALHDVAGCAVPEIAELLGRPPAGVCATLNAARAAVRTAIELQVRAL